MCGTDFLFFVFEVCGRFWNDHEHAVTHPACHTALLYHFIFRVKRALCRSWQDASFLPWQERALKSIQVSACSLAEVSHMTAFLFCCQFVMLHFQESVERGLLRQLCISSYISLSAVS